MGIQDDDGYIYFTLCDVLYEKEQVFAVDPREPTEVDFMEYVRSILEKSSLCGYEFSIIAKPPAGKEIRSVRNIMKPVKPGSVSDLTIVDELVLANAIRSKLDEKEALDEEQEAKDDEGSGDSE